MKIAIDAMGGDFAPVEVVAGVVAYASSAPDIQCILVGDQAKIRGELDRLGTTPSNVSVEHASQVIEMHEHPVEAMRQKQDSSILKCVGMVQRGAADGMISAGNTGAVVAGATFGLGLLEGVKRAGIAIPIPTEKGNCVIIDVGANINCRPINLLQYAVMASQYSRHLFNGVENPAIGLLNIGEESSKGTDLTQQTHLTLKKTHLNFVGNVEGHELFSGKCQVVVCDGFVGNALLKTIEGVSHFLLKKYMSFVGDNESGKKVLSAVAGAMDYSAYGGAPLLGTKGVVIICHGRSKSKAIANAVKVAAELVSKKVNDHIVEEIKKLTWLGRLHDWFFTGHQKQ